MLLQGFTGGLLGLRFCQDQGSASTANRTLPEYEWQALGMPWDTARSNAASGLWGRCGGACTGGFGRAGQVVCGRCGFAYLSRFPEEEAALGNRSAQIAASVLVANPNHTMGHCKVKYSRYSVQQVWWSLPWVLR